MAYPSKWPFFDPSNTIVDPSGDQLGVPTKSAVIEVNGNAPLPSALAIQLDRDTLAWREPGLGRIDLQLIAMIEDARRRLTFRVVYAVQLGEEIWVVHAFQKKSTKGIKTPQHETDLIKDRLKRLKEMLK